MSFGRLVGFRNRKVYAAAIVGVIVAAVVLWRYVDALPAALGQYAGGALWALVVFLLWGFALRSDSTARVALLALATSWLVEFSQLYEAPWIDAIRENSMGHLLIGSTFHAPDLLAYAIGVGLGAAAELLLRVVPRAIH